MNAFGHNKGCREIPAPLAGSGTNNSNGLQLGRSSPNHLDFLGRNVEPSKKRLVGICMAVLENPMPAFHIGITQTDFPKHIDPFLFADCVGMHILSPVKTM
ncbi:MAG: hypothetical protein HQL80_02170 [Magnetococcales bacterium]|nr:hypothetical protein [Magnetococcales bacterium]